MRIFTSMFSARYIPFLSSIILTALSIAGFVLLPGLSVLFGIGAAVFGLLSLVGVRDVLQTKHSVLRNYPVIAHLRYFFEMIRPEMRQYFFEDDKDGRPFPRDKRAVVYQRAKRVLDKRPFGTVLDVYEPSYEWLNHSMAPKEPSREPLSITIGGPDCTQPYRASVFNISGMSFGAISPNAIRAMNKGARLGGFAHVTGEGSVSRYHEEHGGDLIWQIGSGYFGCRTDDGQFDPEKFAALAGKPQIKMIEIKLSQGAKPGHGGVLPKAKITAEIARTRQIPRDRDCVSPGRHPAFETPIEMMRFVADLRARSGGKPVGLKMCVGHRVEVLAIVKAMLETGISPDFIVVDGAEGGTGAAPLEFTDHVGMPLRDGLNYVHNALLGAGLRDKVKLGASGKIASGFDMARVMALGADFCNAARGFMFAVGCIQAQACHTGKCPTGVATTDRNRARAIVVPNKAERVRNFHRQTVEALAELVAAAGLDHPSQLTPRHVRQRISANTVKTYAELYRPLSAGELLTGTDNPRFAEPWARAQAHTFDPGGEEPSLAWSA